MRELVLPALYLLQRKIQIYGQYIIVYILSLLSVVLVMVFQMEEILIFFFFEAVCML